MKLGKCLKRSLKLIDKDSQLRLVKGKPGRKEDTAHFWVIDKSGKVFDPTPEAVPSDYKYEGRIVDHNSVREEIKKNHRQKL